jgi:D-glycero-alpha-D-manno-heptose-7-phosphate kinase
MAPIRVCDNGGWTDTWFAGRGAVFHIAVTPCVDVHARVIPRHERAHAVVLDLLNYDDRYAFDPASPPGRHPLLEAVVGDMRLPDESTVEISVHSRMPPGSATGTSAAVAVALIGAVDALTAGRMTRHEIARAAHRVEVDVLGSESGIQDHLCAAYGGVNFLEIAPYPRARVTQLQLSRATLAELEARLMLVYLGQSHVSSEMHRQVIAKLTTQESDSGRLLDELRAAAVDARDAVLASDFVALGAALRRNCEAQSRLHPDLVGSRALTAIGVAATQGALGWKVNGAGGEGGSVSLLCGRGAGARRDLEAALGAADPSFQVIPTTLNSSGLSVRTRPSGSEGQGKPPRAC